MGSDERHQANPKPLIPELNRLNDQHAEKAFWYLWGPYLSERQWGTVREDYSAKGNAWEYFTHEHARSRAYRWGEDGLAGFSDRQQRLCLALALWNGKDSILKERLFGLSNSEGNHGEDVKEQYYYLDATPTHSYLKFLYKYPQAAFPYKRLIKENLRRDRLTPEFELIDSGIFDDDRYFDVYVEYAKADERDILMVISVVNRAAQAATLHVLPHLWFRNTWSWSSPSQKPSLDLEAPGIVKAWHPQLKGYYWYCEHQPSVLFSENETNEDKLFHTGKSGFFKDAFHDYVVAGKLSAINDVQQGTKAAAHYRFELEPGQSKKIRLRLSHQALDFPFADYDEIVAQRQREADEYYGHLQAGLTDPDLAQVQRQALAGMIWNKQFYYIDIPSWLKGDPCQPGPPPSRKNGRNHEWEHLNNADILSMPDKWEYPWYAAWDLAFQCLPLALVDVEFAKNQLILLTREWYMHPNGQLPAYEWAFGDANPPVHAWATWEVYCIDRKFRGGIGDRAFLERVFHKLMLNFTWWVNRKDEHGNNVFQGGFLGLDNIGVFDRSSPLPTGGHIDQADGSAWMAMYSLNLMRIAIELALHNPVYEDIATKFFEHFLYIAAALNNIGGEGIGLWDDDDKFYYDVLDLPDGNKHPFKIRSVVGLIPLFAVEVLQPETLDRLPGFKRRLEWFLRYQPELAALVSHWDVPGRGSTRLLSLLRGFRMKRLLARMLDQSEFLSDYGIRSLSRVHANNPYTFQCGNETIQVSYWPGESKSWLFGGNSNWRGPIWMPINYLIITALHRFHDYYGDDFIVEHPFGSGNKISLKEIANDLSKRLIKIFTRDTTGKRPVYNTNERIQNDVNFCDNILFYEYFHGDNGHGLGASHQTGWTGLIANLIAKQKE